MDLRNKTALVTGGASGLGLAAAETLAAAGAHVVIADLKGSPGEEVAAAASSSFTFVPTDVTDEDQVAATVAIAGEIGPLSVVVNCAGIGAVGRVVGKNGPLALADFRKVVEVNLIGTFNVIRLAAAHMIERTPVEHEERGVIVNTASVA